MSLPLPTTLSPSKISAFKHCPLQFRFSVIDRLPEPPSPAASKGTLVHRALELLMVRAPADRTQEAALADLERARVELADHEVCLLAVRQGDAASRMQTGRVASLARDPYIEEVLET
jgi:putative RecB family exonuclease